MAVYDFFLSRNSTSIAANYVGHYGRLFYDGATGEIRLSDGATPGGLAIPVALATVSHAGSIKPGSSLSLGTGATLNLNIGSSFQVDGSNNLQLRPASNTLLGGIKLGPGVILNGDGQIIIDSTGLNFNFGDFQATTPAGGAATLSSTNEGQNIDIVSNANGYINVIGNFHVHRTSDYDPNTPDADGAVFAVKTDGQIQMKVPLSDALTGALEIVGNDTGLFLSPNQTGVILHVTGNSGLVSRNYFDANANYVVIAGRRYNGTQLAPRRVSSGDVLLRLVAQGAAATTSNGDAAFPTFGPARIEFTATEDQTPTAQGGEVRILATANGSVANASGTLVASFNATTGLTATGFVGPLTGNVTASTISAATIGNSGALLTGTLTTNAQPYINSLGTLNSLNVTANVAAGNLTTAGNLVANIATLGNITIANNSIYSTLINMDLTLGQLAATANLVVNRTTVHNKDVYVNGNVNIVANIAANNSNITQTLTAGNVAISPSGKLTVPKIVINDGGIRTINGGTTLTVDFSSDSLILWYVPSGDTTITLSNYIAGASTKVIVRMGANGRNIALGVAAVNNTTTGATGSTTIVGHGPGSLYGANQSVVLVYDCIDGTAANTYVTVNYV